MWKRSPKGRILGGEWWCGLAPDLSEADAQRLDRVFERAQSQGLIGRGATPRHEWMHSFALAQQLAGPSSSVEPPPVPGSAPHGALAQQLAEAPAERCLDLGTGAGLPGLVMALCLPPRRWTLADRRISSESFVRWAIGMLEIGDRVGFRLGDVCSLAYEPDMAGCFDLVVARSFGPPAVTAECATAFLNIGGRLVVSEPAGPQPERWPIAPLARCGLALVRRGEDPSFVELLKQAPHDTGLPRRSEAIRRRPLYQVAQ